MSWFKIILAMLGFGLPKTETPAEMEQRLLSLWSPDDRGHLPVVTGSLLLSHPRFQDLLSDVLAASGVDTETFDRLFLPLIIPTLDFIQLFPASRRQHHDFIGGLAWHTLDVVRRVLNHAKDVSPYMPPNVTPSSHETRLYRVYTKVMLTALALAHDVGKIRTNLTIYIVDPDDRSKETVYLSSPVGSLYLESLPEFVERHYPGRLSDVRIRYRFSNSLLHAHSSDQSSFIQAIYCRSRILLPSDFVEYYLPDRDRPKSEKRAYSAVQELITRSDRASASDDRSRPDRDCWSGHVDSPALAVLSHFALSGDLDSLPVREDCLFIPFPKLKLLLSDLDDKEEFLGCHASPSTAARFLDAVAAIPGASNLPFIPQTRAHLHFWDNTTGLFIGKRLTIHLLGLSKLSASSSPASSTSFSLVSSPFLGEPPAPFRSRVPVSPLANDSLDSPIRSSAPSLSEELPSSDTSPPALPESTDVSSHGLPVQSPPDDDSLGTFPLSNIPSSVDPSPPDLRHEPSSTRDSIEILATRLESYSLADLDDPSSDVSLIDGRLTIGRSDLASLLKELRVLRYSSTALLEASDRLCSSLWRIEGGTEFLKLSCTRAYTKAILSGNGDSPLLIGHLSPNLAAFRPTLSSSSQSHSDTLPHDLAHEAFSPDTGGHQHLDNIKSPLSSPPRSTIDLPSFLSSVRSYSSSHPGSIRTENDSLLVPIEAIDAFLGSKALRGELINILKNSSVLIRRSKRFWRLDLDHEGVQQCLSD